jgi:Family of unknown function (DUF6152)
MKRTIFSILIAALGLLFAAVPLAAHHAFTAEFDAQQPVTLHGTVTKVEWTNPHAWINLDVKGEDGQVVAWRVEAGAPNALLRRGFTKNYLPPGAEIVVQGFKAKDGSNRANGSNVTTPDGKKLFLGSSGTGSPDDKKDGK